jgi:hypothetical protein
MMKAERFAWQQPSKPNPKPEQKPASHEVLHLPTMTERIGRAHDNMMRYMKEELGDETRERGALENLNPRKTYPNEYADMRFKPDIYRAEPAILDDLEAAKVAKDEKRIESIRNHLRAISWDSHGRTDDEIAGKIAQELLQESQGEVTGREPGNPFKQTGFDFSNPDIEGWEKVSGILADGNCKGDVVEPATQFVEKKVVDAWRELIQPFRNKKGERSDWPTSYPVRVNPPKLSKEVQEAVEHLVRLRHVRDQLYYKRLFPQHCMYGQLAKKR